MMRGAGLTLAMLLGACQENPRVGEYVWVEVEGRKLPAFVVESLGPTRFRVHYEGCDQRTDEDISLERIKGRVRVRPAEAPGPCPGTVVAAKSSGAAVHDPSYKAGDRIRVRWRGSAYPATVVEVVSDKKFLVHYDGHESAWDETIERDRIVEK